MRKSIKAFILVAMVCLLMISPFANESFRTKVFANTATPTAFLTKENSLTKSIFVSDFAYLMKVTEDLGFLPETKEVLAKEEQTQRELVEAKIEQEQEERMAILEEQVQRQKEAEEAEEKRLAAIAEKERARKEAEEKERAHAEAVLKAEREAKAKAQQEEARKKKETAEQKRIQAEKAKQQAEKAKQQTQKPQQKPASQPLAQPNKEVSRANAGEWMNIEATAYTPYCTGCSGITKNGHNLRKSLYKDGKRVIATDPRLIPMGTTVEVKLKNGQTFIATAQDTGGAIKGHRIDISHQTKKEAYAFGRQMVQVRILK